MKLNDFSLPKFAFLEGSEHEKINITEGRSIIMHVPTQTILEIVDMDAVLDFKMNPEIRSFNFVYHNSSAMKENHKMIVLRSSATELEEIFIEAARWYCEYLSWEDENIFSDENE